MTVLRRAWFPALLAAVTGVLLATTLDLSPAAREAPLWVVVPTFALLLLQLVLDAAPGLASRARFLRRGGLHDPVRERRPEGSGTGRAPAEDRPRRAFRFLLWLSGLLALVWLVGLVPATPLFLGAHMRIEGRRAWSRCLLAAALVGGALWLVVAAIPGFRLPGGWLS